MIDDTRHDLAIEYVFGALEGEAGREFEAWLESDGELLALVDELREATAALAHAAPWRQPPANLRDKVLAGVRGESAPRSNWTRWVPWAAAAVFAVACIVLFADRNARRTAARSAEKATGETQAQIAQAAEAAQSAQKKATGLEGQLALAEVQAKVHIDQIGELRDEVVKLRGRDALAQMKIAALTAQVTTFAQAGAVVVWDPVEQRGIIKIANLPKPPEGKDYQLWVIDPKHPAPVSSGILPIEADGSARIPFRPEEPIENADKFAISVETAGGVPSVGGPIVFMSN